VSTVDQLFNTKRSSPSGLLRRRRRSSQPTGGKPTELATTTPLLPNLVANCDRKKNLRRLALRVCSIQRQPVSPTTNTPPSPPSPFHFFFSSFQVVDPSSPPTGRKVGEGRTFDSDYNLYLPKRVKVDVTKVHGLVQRVAAAGVHYEKVFVDSVSLGVNHMVVECRVGGAEQDEGKKVDDSGDDSDSDSSSSGDGDDDDDEEHGHYEDYPAGRTDYLTMKHKGRGGVDSRSESKSRSSRHNNNYPLSQLHGFSNVSINDLREPSEGTIKKAFSLCRNERRGELTKVLEGGFNTQAVDLFGNNLLHVAASCSTTPVSLGSLIINSCSDAALLMNAKNNVGNTPLHFAIYYGNSDFAEMLIGVGASETIANEEGLTPWEGLKRSDLDEI